MEIRGDVPLRGESWLKAIQSLSPFFTQASQPYYSIYAISMSIGIMYDKQSDTAGEETAECKENPKSVPRTILYQHNVDLDYLFQSAILTSTQVTFTEDERLNLAFNEACGIAFDRISFLTKFANFGVGKLLEQVSDDPIETTQNIKKFLAATVEGYNYEIDSIPEEELDLEDIE